MPAHGALYIDKPEGPTSHDIVGAVRRLLDTKRVGHAGTLDPFASGLLIVAFGQATRLLPYTHGLPKTYEATFLLGAASTTDDKTGSIAKHPNAPIPSEEEVRTTLTNFTGEIMQTPPAYAAVKIAGRKLYEYARKGESVVAAPREVTIHKITLHTYDWPQITVTIECSTGTYIRALARDIGVALGSGGYVTDLRRTQIGIIKSEEAIKLEEATQESLIARIKPSEVLVSHMPSVTITSENVAQYRQGRAVPVKHVPENLAKQTFRVISEENELLGMGTVDQTTSLLSPRLVLN